MLPYNGYWKDLGAWESLSEHIYISIRGKNIISSDSKNTHVINEMNIPITVMELSNTIVAASLGGILFADKSSSSRIKNVIKDLNYRPMFEER
ncbi:hypothetical protein Q4580_20585 [Bacillus thuringiensis]|nr:hypothetical protein [Bacillus thuringiensis]MDO6661735.1 hypothetical protein [Bacillus thuringiensis]MDO6702481.1 hypothetical protein [Bacillus thuringiensis]